MNSPFPPTFFSVSHLPPSGTRKSRKKNEPSGIHEEKGPKLEKQNVNYSLAKRYPQHIHPLKAPSPPPAYTISVGNATNVVSENVTFELGAGIAERFFGWDDG